MIESWIHGLHVTQMDAIIGIITILYGLAYGIGNVIMKIGYVFGFSKYPILQNKLGKFLDWVFLVSIAYLLYRYI